MDTNSKTRPATTTTTKTTNTTTRKEEQHEETPSWSSSDNQSEIPTEEDRKKFLVCLALILASSCDYSITGGTNKDDDTAVTAADGGTNSHSKHPNNDPLTNIDDIDTDTDDDDDDDGIGPLHDPNSNHNSEGAASRPPPPPPSSSSSYLRNVLSFSPKETKEERRRKAQYRKRRHGIASDLLIASAGFLCLEEKEGLCLLPVLDSILSPSVSSESDDAAAVSSPRGDAPAAAPPPAEEEEESTPQPPPPNQNNVNRDKAANEILSTMSHGAAYRCLTLLLFRHLLSCREGYDSRIRHPLKRLGVAVFYHKDKDPNNTITKATKQYESLEQTIAKRLLSLASHHHPPSPSSPTSPTPSKKSPILQTLQIATAGAAAGTLLILTAGTAAPAIAAGLSTGLTSGLTAVGLGAYVGMTAGLITFLSSGAAVSIFGVGGGGLAMWKVKRRIGGLEEFRIRREDGGGGGGGGGEEGGGEPELYRTVCVSGWIRDGCDFQRPWGVDCSDPPLLDKCELLERFYAVFNPVLVPDARRILELCEDEDDVSGLWEQLKEKYGKCPNDNLFPLSYGPRLDGVLDREEEEEERVLDALVLEVARGLEDGDGKKKDKKKGAGGGIVKRSKDRISKWRKQGDNGECDGGRKPGNGGSDGLDGDILLPKESSNSTTTPETPPPKKPDRLSPPSPPPISDFERIPSSSSSSSSSTSPNNNNDDETTTTIINPNNNTKFQHHSTVWDYHTTYSGELYTLQYESKLLLTLSHSVSKILLDLAEQAGKEVLKKTAWASLLYASALPLAIYNQIDSIDGEWVLITKRSEEAGRELARSLVVDVNGAGRRPVTLVGYSFGALVVYACLVELVRLQEEWVGYYERVEEGEEEDVRSLSTTFLGRSQRRQGSQKTKKKKKKKEEKEQKPQLTFEREPASVIEDVILMGLPKYLNATKWSRCREIVSGRLVNVYCTSDKILTLLFRYKNLKGSYKTICGTGVVAVPGVENVDVGHIIEGKHTDYCRLAGDVLDYVGFGQP